MPDPADPIPLEYSGPDGDSRRWRALRRRGRAARGWIGESFHLVISGFAWSGVAWLIVVLPLVLVGFAFAGPVLSFPGLVMVVLIIALVAGAARAVRRRRAAAIIGYLDQAVRLNQPLDRLLAAAARSEAGRLQHRLEDLYLALQGGMSLANAVAAAAPEVSLRAVGQIGYAESTGQLAPALRRLRREGFRRIGDNMENRAYARWYPPVVLTAVAALMGLIGVFVMPKFTYIFHSFRTPLPLLTRVFDDGSQWAVLVAGAMAVVVLVSAGAQLRAAVRGEAPSWLVRAVVERILWRLPFVGRAHRDRNAADLCDAVADAVEQGFPLDAAVEQVGQLDLNGVLRRRATLWFGRMRQGVAPAEAARLSRMPSLLTGLLATAASGDGVAGSLRFAARFYAGRSAARRAVLSAAYVPLVTLVLGVIVALVALSLFLPICSLIDHTAPYPVGM